MSSSALTTLATLAALTLAPALALAGENDPPVARSVQITGEVAEAFHSMVIADTSALNGAVGTRLLNPRYATGTADYTGVALIYMKDATGVRYSRCTASLMDGGAALLTAAHCVAFTSGPSAGSLRAANIDVVFRNADGSQVTLVNAASQISVMPGYTGSVIERRDLAVVALNQSAPVWSTTYGLFTGNAFNTDATFAGFGRIGDGNTGDAFGTVDGVIPRLQGSNRWEVSREGNFLYNPEFAASRGILVYDFDNGSANRNTICSIFTAAPTSELCDDGFGLGEVALGRGDSGGPGFIRMGSQLAIAGVASWVSSGLRSSGALCAQVSCFGAIGGHVDLTYAENRAWVEGAILAATVPEPGTWVLLGSGLLMIGGFARRRQQRG